MLRQILKTKFDPRVYIYKRWYFPGAITVIWYFQEQPPEVFYKKRCSQRFRNIHRKTLLLESLFNKVAGFRPPTSLKKDSNTGVFK